MKEEKLELPEGFEIVEEKETKEKGVDLEIPSDFEIVNEEDKEKKEQATAEQDAMNLRKLLRY